MVLGYIGINMLTYGNDRSSTTYKFKLMIFLVYEGILLILFIMNYLKGMYLSLMPEFDRKVLIVNKNQPGNPITINPS
jgi:hypothetical protein